MRAMTQRVWIALCLLLAVASASAAPAAAQTDGEVTLAAVGDIMLARSIGAALESADAASPFAEVTDILRGSDVTVGNLECAIADKGTPARKAFTFRAPAIAAEALAEAGFDVLSLANNHSLDYGVAALGQTMRAVHAAGLWHVGAGLNDTGARRAVRLAAKGVRLAFLAYVDTPAEGSYSRAAWAAQTNRPGIAWADPAHIREDVAAARLDADVVIVLLHSGTEGSRAPSRSQRAAAYAAIEAGAALVIGSHPHVLQGVERRGDGVIAYSLGNFVFDGFGNTESAILRITLGREGVRELAWTPVIVRNGRPQIATGAQASAILRRIAAMSRP